MQSSKRRNTTLLLMSSMLMLSACSSTTQDVSDSVGGFMSNMSDTLSGTEASPPPVWASEAIIRENQCNTFTRANIESFINSYGGASLYVLSGTADEAGIKAMGTYILSAALINKAQRCMAQALSLQETMSLLEQEKDILLSGTSFSSSEIEKHREYSAQASAQIKEYSQEIEQISPEKRQSFLLGVTTFLSGTYTTSRIQDAVVDYSKKVSDSVSQSAQRAQSNPNKVVGWMQSALEVFDKSSKGGATLYIIGSGLVPHGKNLYNTGEYLIDYSRNNNLDIPADATDEFLSVSGWGDE